MSLASAAAGAKVRRPRVDSAGGAPAERRVMRRYFRVGSKTVLLYQL